MDKTNSHKTNGVKDDLQKSVHNAKLEAMTQFISGDTINRMESTRFYGLTMRYKTGKKKLAKHQNYLASNCLGYFIMPDPKSDEHVLMGILVSELEKDILLEAGFKPMDVIEVSLDDIFKMTGVPKGVGALD